MTTVSAGEAYRLVLKEAGCTLPAWDGVDERVVKDVKGGAAG